MNTDTIPERMTPADINALADAVIARLAAILGWKIPAPDQAVPLRVTGLTNAIITVLSRLPGKPLKGIVIARRCGRKANSHFRAALAALVRDGRIVNVDRTGYRLPTSADKPIGYHTDA